jgi:hypothetical protein
MLSSGIVIYAVIWVVIRIVIQVVIWCCHLGCYVVLSSKFVICFVI